MNKLLLIIDPQIDFINGSLPVPGAEEAMDALARYIREYGKDYRICVITADTHPLSHMSFEANGGIWPKHCVEHSVGAALWPSLYEAAQEYVPQTVVLEKGTDANKEEYSMFANDTARSIFSSILTHEAIDTVDICGIAGDICVSDTLISGIQQHGTKLFRVLKNFCPSLDGGLRLQSVISEYKLKFLND